MKSDNTHGALVYDLLLTLGYERGHTLGVRGILMDAVHMGIEVGEYVLRKGLNQLRSLGLFATKELSLGRGRPTVFYKLVSMRRSRDILSIGVQSEIADELSFRAFSSVASYRAELHRGFLKRRPGRYSRQWLADRLNVCKKTTYNYELRFDDIIVHQMVERRKLSLFEVFVMPSVRDTSLNIWLEIEWEREFTQEELDTVYAEFDPKYRCVLKQTTVEVKKFPYVRAIAHKLRKAGYTVWRCYQSTNYYEVRDE